MISLTSSVVTCLSTALGIAYLDAKYLLSYDLHGARSLAAARNNLRDREIRGRLNNYYYLEEHASCSPEHVFLMFESLQWTNRAMLTITRRWANYFLSLGIRRDEIVALDFTNRPAFVFAMFGLWAIGATPAFINYNLSEQSLLHCLKVSTATIVLCDEEIIANAINSMPSLYAAGVRVIFVLVDAEPSSAASQYEYVSEATIASHSADRPPDGLRTGSKAQDPAVLIYTSGSTGLPKAAIVTWTKFSAGAYSSSLLIGIQPSDRFYTCMPLYHGTGTVLGLGTCLVSGIPLILGKKFSNKTFWPEVRDSKATVIQYVGEICRYLLVPERSPLDSQHNVRMAYGNGLRPDIWQAFRERFAINTIVEFYASTEGIGGSFNYNTSTFGAGAVGRLGLLARYFGSPALSIQIDLESGEVIRTKNGLCVPCKVNEPGEAVYRINAQDPQATFSGYFNNRDATSSKILHNVYRHGDTYLRMGDITSTDADGFTYFHDRVGDTFRFKGENVSTTEVCEAMGQFPGIIGANVYGIKLPNHDGRAGCAALVLDPSQSLNVDALAKHLLKMLPKYAVPQFLRVVETMETTGNHKYQKTTYRNQGVDPDLMGSDDVYWLTHDTYVRFSVDHWRAIIAGKSRL